MANTVAELEALLRGATLGTQRDTITTYPPIWVGGLECSGGSRLYVPIKRFQWRSLGRRGIFVQTDGGANRYVGEFNPETLRAHGYGAEELYGNTYSGQWADGLRHGHVVARWANGTIEYGLYDRNTESRSAVEHKHGAFEFDGEPCAAGDARFAELKRAALESEVLATQIIAEIQEYQTRPARRLEVLIAVILARERRAKADSAADGCTALAAALAMLPSGLVEMVAEAVAALGCAEV